MVRTEIDFHCKKSNQQDEARWMWGCLNISSVAGCQLLISTPLGTERSPLSPHL